MRKYILVNTAVLVLLMCLNYPVVGNVDLAKKENRTVIFIVNHVEDEYITKTYIKNISEENEIINITQVIVTTILLSTLTIGLYLYFIKKD